MTANFSEKRNAQRVPLALPIKGKRLEKFLRSHSFQGQTRDVSYEGLCIKIESTNGFKPGQDVSFKTRLYQGDFLLKAQGKVCWVDGMSDPDWPVTMGVKITHMHRYRLWVERIENKIIESVVGRAQH
jgi:hypothetical protein